MSAYAVCYDGNPLINSLNLKILLPNKKIKNKIKI